MAWRRARERGRSMLLAASTGSLMVRRRCAGALALVDVGIRREYIGATRKEVTRIGRDRGGLWCAAHTDVPRVGCARGRSVRNGAIVRQRGRAPARRAA